MSYNSEKTNSSEQYVKSANSHKNKYNKTKGITKLDKHLKSPVSECNGSHKHIPIDNVRKLLNLGIVDRVFKFEVIAKVNTLRLNSEFNDYDKLNEINSTWALCALASLINHDGISLDDQSFEDMKYIFLKSMNVTVENCDNLIRSFVEQLATGVYTFDFELDLSSLAIHKLPMYKK
jgi:hypothetical protein